MVTEIDFENEQGLQELQRIHARDAQRLIVARAESTEFTGISTDTWREVGLEWERSDKTVVADIERIQIIQTSGTASDFEAEIRTKAGGTNLDIAWAYSTAVSPLDLTPSPVIPFQSESVSPDRFKVYLAIKPNGGTGSFVARITAKPRR